ncbi:MAG TPA: hypothetical protein VF017_05070 [Thermoanaerobaculia bacterium]|nr:hypothetical protein [Thermoanaerobaculia bacterium]
MKRLALGIGLIGVMALVTGLAVANHDEGSLAPTFSLRAAASATYLTTVVSGTFQAGCPAYEELATLQADLGIESAGTSGYYVYLSQNADPNGDQLYEVRIPVTDAAVNLRKQVQDAAKLYRLGTTDVVQEGPRTVVSVGKPAGYSDRAKLYNDLFNYIKSQRWSTAGPPVEEFLEAASIAHDDPIDNYPSMLSVAVSGTTTSAPVKE